ncbi:MAG: oligosaccharide flippase family protein [Alphaproteobacteria bacterium]|nr:oligosaccharide flippase family protein [Alphaproteobacteria bacterium]
MSLHKAYLGTSSVALFSKGFNILSTFGILWLQNAIMTKADFGLFMVAFSLTFTLSVVIATGFQSLILYHVSRRADMNPAEVRTIAGQVFWLSALVGLIFAFFVYMGAGFIADIMSHPPLEHWLKDMALFIPVNTMAVVLPAYSRARQRIKETVFYQEIFLNFLRAGFIGLIWFYSLPQNLISAAYIASALLPVIILFITAPVWPGLQTRFLTKWDFIYGLKSTAFQVLNQPFRGLDIVVIGAFASAGVVADYSMAVRLAQLLWVPKHAVSQLQVPRMGALLEQGNKAQLMLEYDALRCLSLLAVFGGCAFLALFGAPLLALFGDYSSALPALYILAAASIIRTGYGAAGDLIAMIAYPKGSAMISVISVIITMGGVALLAPSHGSIGAAYAILIGTLQMFAGFVYVIEKDQNIKLMSPFILLMNFLPALILMALAAQVLPSLVCGLLMVALGIMLVGVDRSLFIFIQSQRKTAA